MRILVGLVVVLALALPASANLLSSSEGGFEDPWPSQPNAWTGHIERDSGIWGPGGPHSGEHYGSIQSGGSGSGTWTASLTAAFVSGSVEWVLSGYVAGGTVNGSIWIQLIAGSSSDDTIVDSISIPVNGQLTWTPFYLWGHIATGYVKIVAGVHGGGWSSHACHLDHLVFTEWTPEPTSLALFGLVGLPFLRRRR